MPWSAGCIQPRRRAPSPGRRDRRKPSILFPGGSPARQHGHRFSSAWCWSAAKRYRIPAAAACPLPQSRRQQRSPAREPHGASRQEQQRFTGASTANVADSGQTPRSCAPAAAAGDSRDQQHFRTTSGEGRPAGRHSDHAVQGADITPMPPLDSSLPTQRARRVRGDRRPVGQQRLHVSAAGGVWADGGFDR